MAPIAVTWATMESGTVYHLRDPNLIEGFAISPNN